MNMKEHLTVSQAAARLGVSERTIQRRCKNGQLSAHLVTDEDGAQWLIDPTTLPTGDDRVPTHSKAPIHSQKDALTPDKAATLPTGAAIVPTGTTAALLAEKDARINDLRAQVEAWRLQAEAANRTAAETSAALRKALDAMPKALPDGEKLRQVRTENASRENAPQAPIIPPGDQTPAAAKQNPQARVLKPWQRAIIRMIKVKL